MVIKANPVFLDSTLSLLTLAEVLIHGVIKDRLWALNISVGRESLEAQIQTLRPTPGLQLGSTPLHFNHDAAEGPSPTICPQCHSHGVQSHIYADNSGMQWIIGAPQTTMILSLCQGS